jgi:hypothetical protein
MEVVKLGGGRQHYGAVEINHYVDVLIPSVAVHCALEHTVEGLLHFLHDIRDVYIVLPEVEVSICQATFQHSKVLPHGKVTCVSELSVLSRSSLELDSANSQGWVAARSRRGWYYQQLLKLMFVTYPEVNLSDDFLIWDSDNILLAPYSPFIGEAHRFILRQNEGCGNSGVGSVLNGTKIGSYWPATRGLLSKRKYSPAEI